MSIDPHSTSASPIAICTAVMPIWLASTADAYSQGSRSTMSGFQSANTRAIAGSIAVVASRPNSSRFPSTEASAGGATGRRSRIGATSASGGSPPGSNGWRVFSTMAVSAGGATTRVS